MNLTQRAANLVGLAVLGIAAAVYLLTMYPTVPFWDSGEYIAVSKILGIPHPPGTPFYVLIGRIATLVPLGNIAQRVNAVSAVSAALAVWFTYLSLLRLIRLAQRGAGVQPTEREPWHEWVAIAGAFTGALMLAFSDVFWENSTEAEVYQLMSLAQILVFWLGLRWWEAHDAKPTVGPLLLATYVMWLCVGLHLGVGIMGLPLIVLVAMVDWKVALLFAMPFLTLLRVTEGLEKMAGYVILLSLVTYVVFAVRRKLNGIVVLFACALGLYAMTYAFGDRPITPLAATAAVLAVVVPMVMLALKQAEGRVLILSLFLMIAGYSTHIYLPIRAAQHPAVNEGAPASWDKLRDLLERKQYGVMDPMTRRAPLEVQLNKEFWRYFSRQWPVFPTDRLWGVMLPIGLGLIGGVWQLLRDRRGFMLTFTFLGLSTVGMIFFLNFSPNEVRDRDYFFQSGFHAYVLWMGLGLAWLVQWVRDSFASRGARTLATGVAAVTLSTQPFLLMKNLWHTHDRRGNYVARDYAYNMLTPLAPNSFIVTNGDNDTFPLWYLQEVEGIRKDVRVVNLSLLNTDWYIRQLRDEEPKIPMAIDDRMVDALGQGYVQDHEGNAIMTNEYMIHHILEQSRDGDGWKKQPYFAVTVPEHFGYEPFFSLQGLVNEVKRDSLQAGVDEAATTKALYQTFKYRGLFDSDGSWDRKVFKDENASTLSRNYAAAHLNLAIHYRKRGEMDKAIREMERIQRMFPDYTEVLIPLGGFYMDIGDTARAMKLFEDLAKKSPNDPDVLHYYAVSLAYRGERAQAIQYFDRAIQLDPGFVQPYYGAYTTLWSAGEHERALGYMQRWLDGHPGDAQAQQIIQMGRAALGIRDTAAGGFGRGPVMPQLR